MRTAVATAGHQSAVQVATQQEIEEIIQTEGPVLQQKIYVAVGKDLCESVNALKWAFQNLDNRQAALVILLHIQRRIRHIPSAIGKIPVDQVNEDLVNVYMKDIEKDVNKCLDKYLEICTQAKVEAKPLVVEKNDVSKGIVEVVSELGITKLIMGTSSSSGGISRKMVAAGKADYVRRRVIKSCDVWIVCKDKLVSFSPGSTVRHNQKFNRHKSLCPDDFGKLLALPRNFRLDKDTYNQSSSTFPVNGDSTPASVEELNRSKIIDAIDEVSSESAAAETAGFSVEGCSPPEPQRSQEVESLVKQIIEALESSENAKEEAQRETAKRMKAEAAAVNADNRFKCLEGAFRKTVMEKETAISRLTVAEEKHEEIRRQRNKAEENLGAVVERLNQISFERHEAVQELAALREKLSITELDPSVKVDEKISVPSFFICPIFQEVMEDPYVAADSFTYERKAIQGWFDCGKDTSPMTNQKLAHKNLIANFALRSAIREWQEKGAFL
ncbi:hypothetical protein SUGI_0702120 [Cryptomeria japonica]|uniref:U-box domain-containing protein 54 isoform X2 n=1 Tax=Cryptomeria japonica TaxID=3369 RepID=UPI002414B906|nr:U-box domain-containing protein 54 isoform X2 [Cryptomeria japonica]GLJ34874.1 hypothetical protein SUGI_0702120 [Cryptomeria japonica]